MTPLTLKSFFNPLLFNYWAGRALLLSLFVGGLMTCVVVTMMAGIWFEFSENNQSIFFYVVHNLSDNSPSILGIMKDRASTDLNDALAVVSSRESNAMLSLFSLWCLSLYSVFAMSVYWLAMRLFKYKKWLFVTVFIYIYSIGRFVDQTFPHQLNVTYLMQLLFVGLVIITAYIVIKHINKRDASKAGNQTLIAYASQSGTAKNVAQKMAKSSQINCDIRAFSQLTPQCLMGYNQLFVVASTYGDGQAPEKSLGFSQALSQGQQSLSHLSYAVLALGDKAYPHFCAFGHQMASLLGDKGAKSMHPVQEIDRGDPSLIGSWWLNMGEMLGWQSNDIAHHWLEGTIAKNECLNSQKPERPAHAITIQADNVRYQAGDLLEILTPSSIKDIDDKLLQFGLEPQTIVTFNDDKCALNQALTQLEWTNQVANSAQGLVDKLSQIRPRVYSIASKPNDSHIRLLVRQLKKGDGSLGFTSSALCSSLPEQSFKVAIREHDSFRLPDKDTPIIMIAAGTGIAPFMSFLAQRHHQDASNNWLIFGEQYSSHDNYFNDELDDHVIMDTLSRLDYAFSRDAAWLEADKPRYVHDVIERNNHQLYHWLFDKGAHIYVCGNKAGMGESVKLALKKLLEQDYDTLKQTNRLHFDLY